MTRCRRLALLLAIAATVPAAAGPSPALLVLNKAEATLAIVDPDSGRVVGTVPTGDGPHEVVTDGTLAFVSNYGAQTPGSSLSVIDLAARRELRRVDLGALRRPHGLALVDGKVYLTAETNRAVARYDSATDKVDWLLGTGQAGTHMVAADRAGSTLFTTNIGSDTVSVMERTASAPTWTVTQIPVGRGPEGLGLSPDGTEFWAAHSRDGGVSIIDVASKTVTHTLALGTKRSNRLAFTPDGRRVLVSDLDAGELVVIDAKARGVLGRVAVGRGLSGILVAPDGARAFVAATADNIVAVINLDTLDVERRIETGAAPDGMAWTAR